MPAAADDVMAATALVRIGNHAAGSAVLVDERHLLTAWHVVESAVLRRDAETPADVHVVFPWRGGDSFEATVLDVSGSEAVGFAVLKLREQRLVAGVEPVRMWPGQRLPREVAAFGYPLEESEPNGVWRKFTVSGSTTSHLRQLAWDEGAGTLRGQSGGPVVDSASGALVGIVLSGSERGRFDRFLPLTEVESVWKGLRRPWIYAGEDARSHVRRRATGQRGGIQGGDLFKGRRVALEAIESWLARIPGPGRPLVITGQAGAGKSSVLARAILDQESVASCTGVVFHARAATIAELLGVVADAVDAPESAARGAGDLLDHLASREDQARRLVIMVDALDEAVNKQQRWLIASTLTDLARLPWVTVVVATRPLRAGNRYLAGSLLQRLGVSGKTSTSLVDLDVDPYWDRQALLEFTAAVLTQEGAQNPGPAECAWASYRADMGLTGRMAQIIADRADRNFLVAALTATALSTSEEEPVDPTGAGFDPSRLPTTIGEAIDEYLDSLMDDERARVRGILIALAHARGAGISDHMWQRFSSALGYSADQAALDALRDSTAADYLLQTTTEDNETVSRLYHQALIDQLLPTRNSPADHRAILHAVLADVHDAGGWSSSPTYHRSHSADHAVDAGQLVSLLNDTAFVLNADLVRLVAATATLTLVERTPTAVLVLQHGFQAATLPLTARPFFFAMAATHLGVPGLRDAFLAEHPTVVKPVWAHSLGSPHQRLSSHTDKFSVVTLGRLGDRDVIVSGSYDGTVRIWDATGRPVVDPLTGHSSSVSSVAVGRLGDRDVIVSGSGDGTVRVWDAAGHPVGDPINAIYVYAVAVGGLGDRDVIVTGGMDSRVWIWDAAGQPVGDPLSGHAGNVCAVAVGRLGDRDVIVSGSDDRTVRIWDAAGHPVGEPLTGHTHEVHAVAVGRLGDREVIVSGSWDATVRIWDADGHPVGHPLTGHTAWVVALAVGRLGDRDVIVSGSWDATVRIWDADGHLIGHPLSGHSGNVYAVALGRLGDREVIVSCGGGDYTVRIWDPAGHPFGHPLTGHTARVAAMAVGRLGDREVIVSGSMDTTVRIWDLTGQPVADPLTGHTSWVRAVAVGRLGDRDVIVSGSNDRTVRVWDATGRPVGDPFTGHTEEVHAVAVGRLGDRDVIVSGGGDRRLRIWDAAGRPVGDPLTLPDAFTTVYAVAIGRLGGRDLIVSGSSDGALRIWDATGHLIGTPLPRANIVSSAPAVAVGLLGDREVIVSSGSDNTVRIWDATGRPIGEALAGHTAWVGAVAVGRLGDRDVIVSGSHDRTVRIWDAAGRPVGDPLFPVEPCSGLALSARGIIMATGGAVALLDSI